MKKKDKKEKRFFVESLQYMASFGFGTSFSKKLSKMLKKLIRTKKKDFLKQGQVLLCVMNIDK